MNLFSQFKVAFIAATALILVGCGQQEQVDVRGSTMGTYYAISYVVESGKTDPSMIKAELDQHLLVVNQQMSTYMPDSELSRFNRSQVVNAAFPVSAATRKVVQKAIDINRLTYGALDVTVGPLVNLWGFGPEARPTKLPKKGEIEQRRAWIGIEHLAVTDEGLIKKIPQLYVDLSSIAKGYGVDMVAEFLISKGINDFMVDIGGEVRTQGRNGRDMPWRIAIERPSAGIEQSAQLVIQPGSKSIATSGGYRNYFEEKGQRYSHTIDPKTGRPITHKLVSITVLADDCMTADGFATGLDVLGPDRGLEVANQLNLPVYMIVKGNKGFEERYSKAFETYLSEQGK